MNESAAQTPAGTPSSVLQIAGAALRPSSIGAAENFTGTVVVDGLFGPNAHSAGSGGVVTFTPGAQTAWHAHPVGQTLVVTAGRGWIQAWGEARRDIQQGDVVWIPPGVKHWHGASATHAMTHIALQEVRDGSAAQWMELVDDSQYLV
jgi:quercetin dioxygenase-like cupin family protein